MSVAFGATTRRAEIARPSRRVVAPAAAPPREGVSMRRSYVAAATLSLAPWVLAGSLLLGEGASVAAQDTSPAPVGVSRVTGVGLASADSQEDAGGGEIAPPAMPSAGVGSGIAAVFAFRERLKNR